MTRPRHVGLPSSSLSAAAARAQRAGVACSGDEVVAGLGGILPTAHAPAQPTYRQPAQETHSPSRPTPQDLAWAFAAEMGPILRRGDRNRIYAKIGADDHFAAIRDVLTLAIRRHFPLSAVLVRDASRMLDAYVGNPVEPCLRDLLRKATRPDATA